MAGFTWSGVMAENAGSSPAASRGLSVFMRFQMALRTADSKPQPAGVTVTSRLKLPKAEDSGCQARP